MLVCSAAEPSTRCFFWVSTLDLVLSSWSFVTAASDSTLASAMRVSVTMSRTPVICGESSGSSPMKKLITRTELSPSCADWERKSKMTGSPSPPWGTRAEFSKYVGLCMWRTAVASGQFVDLKTGLSSKIVGWLIPHCSRNHLTVKLLKVGSTDSAWALLTIC